MMWQQVLSIIGCPLGLLCLLRTIHSHWKKQDLKGKVVLITGANSGLGKACVVAFYEAGCKIIMAGRKEEELNKVREEVIKMQVPDTFSPKILVLDLMDYKNMDEPVSKGLKLFGHIDILINNAGVSYRGEISSTQIQVDERVMAVNYFGQVALIKEILPHMRKQGGGSIVNISSVQGKIAIPYRSAYAASKHALQAFCDTLRAEVSSDNINVCVVSPGYIQTNLSQNAVCGDGSTYNKTDSTTASGMKPTFVAHRILKAVKFKENDIVLAPLLHKLVIFIRTFIPSLFFLIMNHRAKSGKKEFSKPKTS
uniref:Dehydrogenase/reductase SDR family protein 7-like n=1 Tax=Crassostrea virginica TaxID=6565 RepID=A0A8B8CHC9_CRAVI|nr:dehydrogenase/reductase SDR family protein 7-like [Crassostrea virginica]XP_022315215.1 dehydrogenase/reductase SDR family protein 7-like [Crassostrea virginica]XP_022315217.1 dehydrogenase/reductase SDR family protein 7-like [Crassostrea virginica]